VEAISEGWWAEDGFAVLAKPHGLGADSSMEQAVLMESVSAPRR
jgi:hypothetical protein